MPSAAPESIDDASGSHDAQADGPNSRPLLTRHIDATAQCEDGGRQAKHRSRLPWARKKVSRSSIHADTKTLALAAAGCLLLDRRAWHGAVGAKDAAITSLGL